MAIFRAFLSNGANTLVSMRNTSQHLSSPLKMKHVLKESLSIKRRIEPIFTCLRLTIDPKEQFFFSCCDNKVKVINVEDAVVLKSIPATDEDDGDIVNFQINNEYLFIAYKNGFIKQWSYRDEEPSLRRVWDSQHVGPIALMVFDTNSGTLLATGGCDSLVKVWDTEGQYITHYLKGCQGVISSLVFQPNPPDTHYYLMASGHHDPTVNVYDLRSSKLRARLQAHVSSVTGIAFLHNQEGALTVSRDKIAIVWCLQEFSPVRKIPMFESIESLILLPEKYAVKTQGKDNTLFMTGGESGILKVWSLETGKMLYAEQDSSENVKPISNIITQLFLCEDRAEVVVVTGERNILFYKLPDLSVCRQYVGHNDEVLDVKFIGDEQNHIVVATNSADIKIFDTETTNCVFVKGHSDIVVSLSVFDNDRSLFASGSKDNTSRIWKFDPNLMSVACLFLATGHANSVTAVATPSKSVDWMVTGSQDTTLKLWHIPANKAECSCSTLSSKAAIKAHDKDVNSLAVSPNDKLLCSGSQDKTAKLWDVDEDLKLRGVLRGHRRGIWCVRFSTVDKVVATSSGDATIRVWSIADLSCLKTFQGHECSVLNIWFVTRGMQLVSTSSDGNLKIWSVKNNECTKTIDAHQDKTWALYVSCDEQRFVTAATDSNIILWNDSTIEEKEQEALKVEGLIEREQTLMNLIQKRKWTKALKIAITLDQPFRALNIINEIVCETSPAEESKDILFHEALNGLREDQLMHLLRYAVKWNTNSKHCEASQKVLSALLKLLGPEKIMKAHDSKELVQHLLPFTERHFKRVSNLYQQATFLEFLWSNVRLSEA